jgi:CarD family transcriptional regulator
LKTRSFEPGDKVVYPGHGVGEIDSVVLHDLGGGEQEFYQITMLDSKRTRIMVPVDQADTVGLRRVVDQQSVDKVFEILRDRDFKIDNQTWNRRYRDYSQKLKTGSLYEIAEVLRDLCVLSAGKELSFGEKKMLESAQNLLVSEIAIVKARSYEKVMGELQEIFFS